MDIDLKNIFNKYNVKYFESKLGNVDVSWSDKMTLCSGKTYLLPKLSFRSCKIMLSNPLLKQRPMEDTINTLLHEMIHAFLYITKSIGQRESHGQDFQHLMKKINLCEGTKIKIRHNFHKEVDKFRVHVYKCDGPCRHRRPFFGVLRRAITRPPGPEDHWWERHVSECGGTFIKVTNKNNSVGCHQIINSPEKKLIKNQLFKPTEMRRAKLMMNNPINVGYNLVSGNVDIEYKTKLTKYKTVIEKYLNKYFQSIQSNSSVGCSDDKLKIREGLLIKDINSKFPIDKYVQRLNTYRSQMNLNVENPSIEITGNLNRNNSHNGIIKSSNEVTTVNVNRLCPSNKCKQQPTSSLVKNVKRNQKSLQNLEKDKAFPTITCSICKSLIIMDEYNYHLQLCKDSFSTSVISGSKTDC